MIRNLDPSSEAFLAQLERIETRLTRAQTQMGSGVRVAVPSDDPDDVSAILQLHAEIARNTQIRTSLTRAESEVKTADGALARGIELIDRAILLATEGSGTTATAERRSALAEQAQGLLEDMVSLSQTMVEGRFLFGGDQDLEAPYSLDLTAPEGVKQLQTSAATRVLQHPSGTGFTIRKTAQEIFDPRAEDGSPAAGNVFAALNALRLALAADDQQAVTAASAGLHQASGHLNVQESFYGGAERRIESAITDASRADLRLKAALSDVEDADLTAAVLEFSQAQLGQRAAMSAHSQLAQTSLFDFLK
jgi:flagellar hook-associated protein 3 FlgL